MTLLTEFETLLIRIQNISKNSMSAVDFELAVLSFYTSLKTALFRASLSTSGTLKVVDY